MWKRRRILSLILAFALIFSSVPAEVLAVSDETESITEKMQTDSMESSVEEMPEDVEKPTDEESLVEEEESIEEREAELESNQGMARISGYEAFFSGTIKDSNGNGVEAVSVVLFEVTDNGYQFYESTMTDDSGKWIMDQAWIGDVYVVSYYKAGYTFSENDFKVTDEGGGLTLETVVAHELEIEGLVCKEEDFTYKIDINSEIASITGYTGSDYAIQLPEYYEGYPVTQIASNAFTGNTSLETIVFSGGITTINSYAFNNCTSLEHVYLPNMLSSINDGAFRGCTALESIELPNSVTNIGYCTFQNCMKLNNINYSISLKTGGSQAYAGCTNLKRIIVPEGVVSIANNAFDSAESLEEVILPDSVTSIGSYAFSACTSLKTIELPNGLTTIHDGAFSGCTMLESMELPDSVTSIGYRVFRNCMSLGSINYPTSLETTGSQVYMGCTNLKSITVPDGVTFIPNNAFDSAESLEEVILPDSVIDIGSYAFSACTSLKAIELPEGLKVIHDGAFNTCTALESIELPNSVTNINYRAFRNCTSLGSINYPTSLETTGTQIYSGCTSLKSITVPDGVTFIPDNAFDGADCLEEVVLSDSVASIGSYAFSACTSLKGLELPNDLTVIRDGAFNGCTALESIVLPDGVMRIGYRAFRNCTKLKSMNYPLSLKETGSQVYSGCTSLKSIIIPDGVTEIIYDAFSGAESLEEVILPDTLTKISGYAFNACTSLVYVTIPDNVTTIDDYAFHGCSALLQIWLGGGVLTIGSSAFKNCSEMTIHGIEGSYAETYAAEHGIPFSTETVGYDLVSLGGTVKDSSGNPLDQVIVSIYDLSEGEYIYTNEQTKEDGNWTIPDAIIGHEYMIQYYRVGYRFEPNSYKVKAIAGGVVMDPVTAVELEIEGLVCNEGDYTYSTNKTSETAIITGYKGIDSAIRLPEYLGGYPVTQIASNAFTGNTSLETVVFSGMITTINSYAFTNCTSLKNVYLPNVLSSVNDGAFRGCTALEHIELPDSVTYIGYRAFQNCTKLSSMNYPFSLKTTGSQVYAGCTNLKSIMVPEGVTSIPNSAFDSADCLEEVVLPDSVTSIGTYAFSACTSLKGIELPSGLTEIRDGAFYACTALESIEIPDRVTSIGYRAFRGCTNLKNINYPLSLSTTGTQIYSDCTNLKSITVPEGVTSIPNNAFDSANCLEEVILPDGVTSIGSYAFSTCTSMKGIELPETLTRIHDGAFYACTALESIEIPDGVTNIGYRAFRGCENLESINYPLSLSTTGTQIYSGCTNLKSITVPEGVTSIPNNAFDSADCLEKVIMPDTLNHIGIYAFYGCTSLQYVIIPENVEVLGDYAFCNCSDMRQVWLGSGLTLVGNNTFKNCSKLTIHGVSGSYAENYAVEHEIPFSTETVGYNLVSLSGSVKNPDGQPFPGVFVSVYDFDEAKYICTNEQTDENGTWMVSDAIVGHTYMVQYYKAGYTFETNNLKVEAVVGDVTTETVTTSKLDIEGLVCNETDYTYDIDTISEYAVITGYTGNDTAICLPESLGGYPVVQVAANAFSNNITLETVVFSEMITGIYSYAFSGCTALENIYLPNSLTSIYDGAFSGCTSLEKVALPDSVTSIGYRAFRNCTKLAQINYPLCLDTVGTEVYAKCSSLISITVSEGVVNLANNAFNGAEYLEEVVLSKSLTSIGSYAFSGCEKIQSIELPDNITKIQDGAFNACTSLESIVLPDRVTSIGYRAFRGCTNLKNINYPMNLNETGTQIYADCSSLTSITVPEGVAAIPNNAFDGANYLQKVVLPNDVTRIGSYAFSACISLKEIELPEGLTVIRDGAFNGCTALKRIELPDSVTDIGYRVFRNCERLESINYPLSLAKTGNQIYMGCLKLSQITVPEGVVTIPYDAFSGADCLKEIVLPNTLTHIDRYAFNGCTDLRIIKIPANVTDIGEHAFENTNLIIEAPANSMGIIYAINHGISFIAADEVVFDESTLALEKNNSSYFMDMSSKDYSGNVKVYVNYKLKENASAEISNKQIVLYIPSNTILNEGTLMLDGMICQNYVFDETLLTIPVDQNEGTITFYLQLSDAEKLLSYCLMEYERWDEVNAEVIGLLQEEMDIFSIEVEDYTSTDQIEVSGVAPKQQPVDIYVGSTLVRTVRASKTGKYKTIITLPSVTNNTTYQVTAKYTKDDITREVETSITYKENMPKLTGFKMYYNNHSNTSVDLLNAEKTPYISFAPSIPFTFTVEFENAEQVNEVYIVSTRNNERKIMEAEYDDKSGMFIASGHFDEKDTRYVPGELSVEYNLDVKEYKATDYVDWETRYNQLSADIKKAKITQSGTDKNKKVSLDFSEVDKELQDTGLDFVYKELDFLTESDYSTYLELLKVPGKFMKYLVPGEDGKTYEVFIDYSDPSSYTMIISDAASVANTAVEIELSLQGEGTWTKLHDVAPYISYIATGAGVVHDIVGFAKDRDELKQEIYQSPAITNKAEALRQADQLYEDQAAFTIFTAVLPMIVTVGIGMTGPAAIGFTCLIGIISATSSIFWQWRIGNIRSGGFKARWAIDPSGYVYEAVTANRLADVKTTAYYKENEEDTPIIWDASEFDQINPLYTDYQGRYAWDVPEGLWQVKYELEGYETTYSEWLEVPPPQTDVNVGMVSKAVPKIEGFNAYSDYAEIVFSKYMIPDSVNNLVLKDEYGNAVAYTLEYAEDETDLSGNVYARVYKLMYDESDTASYTLNYDQNLKSYADVAMETGSVETKKFVSKTEIVLPEIIKVPYAATQQVVLDVHNYNGGEIQCVSSFDAIITVKEIGTVKDEKLTIFLEGCMVGTADLTIGIAGENNEQTCQVVVLRDMEVEPDDQEPIVLPFTDVPQGKWFYNAVKWAYENGLLTGTSDTEFSPTGQMTRGMLVTVLYRKEGRPVVDEANKFPDVNSKKYYASAITWASAENLVSGYSNGDFGPEDSITREQIAKILYLYAKYKGYDVTASADLSEFSDASKVSSYAKKYMQWTVAEGLIQGSNGVLNPKGNATRAEIAAILKRFVEKYELQ